MRNVAVALPLFLLFAAACSSGSSTAANRCTTDAQCPAGALCKSDGTCGCKTDDACEDGQFCNDQNVCQAREGCRANSDCASSELCDLGTGACLPRTACGAATHCDSGSVCDAAAQRCVSGCYDDGDCPLYNICERTGTAQSPLGRCVAGKCGDRTFCELGDRCVNQSCTADTSVNCDACDPQMQDSCGPGNYCLINPRHDPADPTSGAANYCGTECDSAEDCGNGYSCTRIVLVSGSQPLCRDDNECQAPRVCRRSGENDPRGFCTCAADADCALDVIRACQGTCGGLGLLPCTDNAECPSRNCVKRCLGSNTMCTDSADCAPQSLCAPGGFGGMACLNTGMPCQSGADCLCNAGRCFGSGRPCTTAAQCQLTCQDGGCVLGAGCGPIEGLTCEDLR